MEEVYPKKPDSSLDNWLTHVTLSGELPDGKGTVVAINTPEVTETKFGRRGFTQVEVQGKDGSIVNVRLFLPQQFPMIHPKSNLAKIMRRYGCKTLNELIGKEVEVIAVGDALWKIKAE